MKRVILILAAVTLVATLATGTAFAAKKQSKQLKIATTEVPVTDWAGEITGTAGPNEYLFAPVDTTYGTPIILDCGPAWFAVVNLALGSAIVTGELESKDGGTTWELDAHSVTDSTSATFTIKGEGKPPWAGGRGHK